MQFFNIIQQRKERNIKEQFDFVENLLLKNYSEYDAIHYKMETNRRWAAAYKT